jgi:two-component system sensor histidine kinase TctE
LITARAPASLRRQLLLGILLPVLAVVMLNAALLYRQALTSADTAYDRTLLASAKAIGEQLQLDPGSARPRVIAELPYAALEAFEADNRSRMVYRVSGFDGEVVSGFDDLPPPRAADPRRDAPPVYAALVRFYDDRYRDEPVRMAVLLQPVAGAGGQGMAVIQVAETLELRHALARQLLVQTLWQQGLLLVLIAGVVLWVVQR